jgi:hypothetical protein
MIERTSDSRPQASEKESKDFVQREAARNEPRESSIYMEIFSAALMALATIATAWCAFQASIWTGIQTFTLGEVNAARLQAASASNSALQLTSIDVGMFIQYAAAISQGNERLADFLLKRFRPEMRPAVDAWLETKPLQNPGAPSSPFMMPQYRSAALEEAESQTELAAAKLIEADDANRRSSRYLLLTVVFASILFFEGISTRFQSPSVKRAFVYAGAFVFAAALAVVLTFPVSFGNIFS